MAFLKEMVFIIQGKGKITVDRPRPIGFDEVKSKRFRPCGQDSKAYFHFGIHRSINRKGIGHGKIGIGSGTVIGRRSGCDSVQIETEPRTVIQSQIVMLLESRAVTDIE